MVLPSKRTPTAGVGSGRLGVCLGNIVLSFCVRVFWNVRLVLEDDALSCLASLALYSSLRFLFWIQPGIRETATKNTAATPR